MKQTPKVTTISLALATALGACSGNTSSDNPPPSNTPDLAVAPGPVYNSTINYEQALRTAAIKLTGNFPTLAEIKKVRDSANQAADFQALIDDYMTRPTFAARMLDFWRDTFKMGGPLPVMGMGTVMLDYAPTYATYLTVKDMPFTNILTATSGTCQTLDPMTGNFTQATCPNTATAGVLSDAGVQAQFYSNMAFRRVRWLQETFMCQRFPAETNGMTVQHPGGVYVSPWPFNSITGNQNAPSAKIDFQDDKSIICANCHTTMNHQALLFAKFSNAGMLTTMIQVQVPVPGMPTATPADWLPSGEMTAWRFGKPAADLTALGAAVVADPGFATCMATRIWNWALSRPDVVDDQATLTTELAGMLVTTLTTNNWSIKKLTRYVFTSDSFIRY